MQWIKLKLIAFGYTLLKLIAFFLITLPVGLIQYVKEKPTGRPVGFICSSTSTIVVN